MLAFNKLLFFYFYYIKTNCHCYRNIQHFFTQLPYNYDKEVLLTCVSTSNPIVESKCYFRFPNEVTRSITFCEQSKSDVSAIAKAVELMIANFKATGMTPADSIANTCAGLAAKTNNEKVKKSFT